jgi:hypothetical protein
VRLVPPLGQSLPAHCKRAPEVPDTCAVGLRRQGIPSSVLRTRPTNLALASLHGRLVASLGCLHTSDVRRWRGGTILALLQRLQHNRGINAGTKHLKLSRRKRYILSRRPSQCRDTVEIRKAKLEAEVVSGVRDARTLVSIPADLARRAKLLHPLHPFGEPDIW